MDHCVLHKKCVNCELIEADGEGNTPNMNGFDKSSQSLLDVLVEQDDKV